jgi:hypothetical protein
MEDDPMLRRRSLAIVPLLVIFGAAAARPALAEPIPPDLPRLAGVPIELYTDWSGVGHYDHGDLVGNAVTDVTGHWMLAVPRQYRHLIVVRIGDLGNFYRIGGDLQYNNQLGFDPYNGVPVKRLWDTHYEFGQGWDGLFQLGLDFNDPAEDQVTRAVGLGTGGDYRFEQVTYLEDSAIVLYVPSSDVNRNLRGWLWDATNDDN